MSLAFMPKEDTVVVIDDVVHGSHAKGATCEGCEQRLAAIALEREASNAEREARLESMAKVNRAKARIEKALAELRAL